MPQVIQLLSPRPFTPQRGGTCRPTSADARHTHIYNTRLDSRSWQEHAHARVCPALTYSVHQCPGVKSRALSGVWRKGPIKRPKVSRDETSPGPQYGIPGGSMHAISSYRGNRPTNTPSHRQDRLHCAAGSGTKPTFRYLTVGIGYFQYSKYRRRYQYRFLKNIGYWFSIFGMPTLLTSLHFVLFCYYCLSP